MYEIPGPQVSLIIPACNEEACIAGAIREANLVLSKEEYAYEILVVDDGSSDGTFARLRGVKADISALRVLRFAERRGQTAAMAAGFERARGEVVVAMDADMQNDPADIPRLLEKIGEWDVVCGYRRRRRDNWLRRLSAAIANAIRNWCTGDDIRDSGCTLKAFRRCYLQRLKLFDGMHRFLPTLLGLEGARVTQVPVNHRPRRGGRTKYGIRNRLFRGLRDLFAVRWMQARHIEYTVREEL